MSAVIDESQPPDREAITQLIRAGLYALEADDEAAWRTHLDSVVRWRTQPLVQGVARLARELNAALGEGATGRGALPDACARLEHVVTLTEQASLRTLDQVSHCRALLTRLPFDDAAAATHAELRAALSDITAAQAYQDLTGQIIRRVVELLRSIHDGLGHVIETDAPASTSSRGHGPAVAGVDAPPVTQDDANHLLSALGL